jgi:hypothetical protein
MGKESVMKIRSILKQPLAILEHELRDRRSSMRKTLLSAQDCAAIVVLVLLLELIILGHY